jgi:2-C-methyl-D-erythritol 4-phosphate cytidylyltransferase/2-C-methyl-D-erythritol 2,4-cyclodiphosphate synthase
MEEIIVAVVPAAGQGLRMGGPTAKQFMTLGGLPLLTRTCLALEAVEEVAAVVLAVPPGTEEQVRRSFLRPYPLPKVAAVMAGGKERQDSVAAGCEVAARLGASWVVVHDAVRPLAPPSLFSRVIAEAKVAGAAIAAVPIVDTVKREGEGRAVAATVDRRGLWLVQTPQAFRLDLLRRAQEEARARGLSVTDEAGLVEALGGEVKLVMGSRENLKITSPEDLALAQAILGRGHLATRTGQGVDAHKLVPGRDLILGGVRLEYELGLLGHSDADVLTHAVMDALLSAAGLGDIGRMFPDSDPTFKDADSLGLLTLVTQALGAQGWRPAQVTVTLLAQRPKIAPHAPAMAVNLARAMGIEASLVNVAATTSEGLGFAGRGEGMAALATAVIAAID